MANKKNKVKFNIRNVHYAKLTIGEDGSITYSTPVAMPGAVSLSLDPNGEPSVFYADGYAYYTISNNQGYEGDLELAMVPESFRTDILKETMDDNSVLIEDATVETEKFGISIRDLDLLTIGMVNDMFVESRNDEYPYREIAGQDEFDNF